jgi:GNAT superfamily N-acetyltransferase
MIRRAEVGDVPGIARLAAQLGGATELTQLPARLSRILEHASHAVFVAEGDAGLSGFAAAEHRLLLPFGEWVELMSLVVDEDSRRQGLGAQLVAAVEAWAARRGVQRVLVRSSVTRDAAHPFYRGLGYAHLKTQHVYVKPGADAGRVDSAPIPQPQADPS